jgi:hypothetical protein
MDKIDLSATPYYDDFSSDKNFYRILFKPGTAVQARELTQVQSILQDQIKKFANHIFVDGSRALKDSPVSVTINRNVRSVKLQESQIVTNVNSFKDLYVTSLNSNIIGRVEFVYDADNPTIGDPKTIVLNIVKPEGRNEFPARDTLLFYQDHANAFIKANTSITATTADDTFVTGRVQTSDAGDEITLLSSTGAPRAGDLVIYEGSTLNLYVVKLISDARILLSQNFGVTSSSLNVTFQRKNTSPSLIVGISSGAYYKNGYFVQVPYQSIVPEKYTAYPSKSVILKYQESIVNYNDDDTLLDPAFGSSNYLAPGADRLKIELVIDSVELNDAGKPNYTGNYIEVVRFSNGKEDLIESAVDSTYAALGTVLADRTYAESGNYTVEPFTLTPGGTTSDGQKNKFYISAGRAFVGGYDISTSDKTEITIPKSRTTKTIIDNQVNTVFGPYILIEPPVYGLPDVQNTSYYDYYECHSTANVDQMSDLTDPVVAANPSNAANSTLVGFVLAKHIEYDNGYQANAVYKFFWDDYVQWNSVKSVLDIRSIIGRRNWFSANAGSNGSYTHPTFFANVSQAGLTNRLISLTARQSVIVGKNLKLFDSAKIGRLVYPVGPSYIKDIRRNRTVYNQLFKDVQINAGVASVSVASPSRFIGSQGALSSSLKRQYYLSIIKGTTGIDDATLPGGGYPWKITSNTYVPLDSVTLSLDSTGTSLTINYGNTSINSKTDISASIYNDQLTRKTKTLVSNYVRKANILVADQDYSVFKSDVYNFKGVYKTGSNVYMGDWDTNITYGVNQIVQNDGLLYQVVQAANNTSLTDTRYWRKLTPESSLLYYFNNGQEDKTYNHGKIRYIGSSNTLPGTVMVVFDYFTHSAGGYFDAVSYPTEMYDRIPIFKSPRDGSAFNLRDSVDYRNRRQDDTGYYNSNYYGPNDSSKQEVSDIFLFTPTYKPIPDTTTGTQVDVDFYQSRIDRLYIQNRDSNVSLPGNKFYLDFGIPDVNPKPNNDLSDRNSQLLATLISPPYTSSSTDVAIIYNNNPRYTMKDISIIDSKLTSLEKRVKRQGVEILALNNTIYDRDGNEGNVLFKTGIMVEDFSSLNVADIENPHHTVAIDTINHICRPAYTANWHNLFYVSDPDVSIRDNFVTMNYTEEVYLSVASTTTAANSYIIVNPTGNSTDSSRSGASIGTVLVAATIGALLAPVGVAATIAGAIIGGIIEVGSGIIKKVFEPSTW